MLDLGFLENRDFFIIPEDDKIYFAIKFNSEYIDEIAHKLQKISDLKTPGIKMPFARCMTDYFTAFGSRQRLQCIQEYLESEIDFDYYDYIDVIDKHYPLHKVEGITEINKSFDKYNWKL
jgi:hypothetical protein